LATTQKRRCTMHDMKQRPTEFSSSCNGVFKDSHSDTTFQAVINIGINRVQVMVNLPSVSYYSKWFCANQLIHSSANTI
jgi:hypothetical protein